MPTTNPLPDGLIQGCATRGLRQTFTRPCTCNLKCTLWRPCINKISLSTAWRY